MGSLVLPADPSNPEASYHVSTGRLYIQGGSSEERRKLGDKAKVPESEIEDRRRKEEGDDGMLEDGEWAVYDDADQVRITFACCLLVNAYAIA